MAGSAVRPHLDTGLYNTQQDVDAQLDALKHLLDDSTGTTGSANS